MPKCLPNCKCKKHNGGLAGGIANAVKRRDKQEKEIESYYQNPVHCLNCDSIIKVGKRGVLRTKKQKFCNTDCHNTYKRNEREKRKTQRFKRNCPGCGKELSYRNANSYKEAIKTGTILQVLLYEITGFCAK